MVKTPFSRQQTNLACKAMSFSPALLVPRQIEKCIIKFYIQEHRIAFNNSV